MIHFFRVQRSIRTSFQSSFRRVHIVEKVVAFILFLIFLPIIGIASLIVIAETGRPAWIQQARVGLNQKEFQMFKLRTMQVGAEAQHEKLIQEQLAAGRDFLLHKPHDTRVTTFGKFLREWSIDELPQLLNVMNGTMSFVGPRPILPKELDFLDETQRRRFMVLPGITGLAQIRGRSSLGAKEYFESDLEFIERRSGILYWKIIGLTPFAVLSRRGTA